MKIRKRVFICSPYAGDIEQNIKIAQAMCLRAIKAGYAPFAPHLIYPTFLDDNDGDSRQIGIDCGIRFLNICDAIWVYSGKITSGMQEEIEAASLSMATLTFIDPADLDL